LEGLGIRGPLGNDIGQIDEMDQNLEESNQMQISKTKKQFGKKKDFPKKI
jgi:hypothetical protein